MKVDKMFDVVQPKETDKIGDDGKPVTRWQNLGIAFEKDGKISGIKLEALPLPDKNGEVWIRLFEKKPKDQQQNNVGSSAANNDGDDIPW